MENISFLKDVLMSDHEYWVVANRNPVNHLLRERHNDSIILIVIPYIKRSLKYEEITLKQLEDLRRMDIPGNVHLSEPYAPFQAGLTLYNIHNGYPITTDVKQFLIDALKLESTDLWDYKKLIKEPVLETA